MSAFRIERILLARHSPKVRDHGLQLLLGRTGDILIAADPPFVDRELLFLGFDLSVEVANTVLEMRLRRLGCDELLAS